MKRSTFCFAIFSALLLTAPLLAEEDDKPKKEKETSKKDDSSFTKNFGEEKSDLVSSGKNPYFILEPGFVSVYRGKDGDEDGRLLIVVTKETKMVDGVETRVVEEREAVGGDMVEVSRNFFAISKRTNNVYYFGEETVTYKHGKETGREGSWEAGVKGAHYGLVMPGVPLLGSKFYQEHAEGEAMDRAEVVSLTTTKKTPMGDYKNCVKMMETSPLEAGKEYKIYARGVGLVNDEDLLLVKQGMDIDVAAEEKAAK
ncbi:hypothetical protein BH09SUM1_BH09SUM1_24050 [soil metagenome]